MCELTKVFRSGPFSSVVCSKINFRTQSDICMHHSSTEVKPALFHQFYFSISLFSFPHHFESNRCTYASLWHVHLHRLVLLFIDLENANGCVNIPLSFRYHIVSLFLRHHISKCGARVYLFQNGFSGFSKLLNRFFFLLNIVQQSAKE